MTSILRLLARVATRMHRWRLASYLFVFGGHSLQSLGEDRPRLAYSLMMCGHGAFSRGLLAHLLRRSGDGSAEDTLWLARMATHLGCIDLALLLYRRAERRFAGTLNGAVASSLHHFFHGALSGSLSADLSERIRDLPALNPASPLVLTVVSARFLEVFRIWMRQVQTHTRCQPLVVALDGETAKAATAEFDCPVVNVSHWLMFDEKGRMEGFTAKTLWILRVFLLHALLCQGRDVVSLDTDAIPVGSLEEMLQSLPTWDVAAQRDYSIPMEVARKFGFILCCGFMAIRSNERTIRFFREYSTATLLEMDDQVALNHMLAEAGITERHESADILSFRSMGLSWCCPSSSHVSRELRSGSVIRHFHLNDLTTEDIRRGLGLASE